MSTPFQKERATKAKPNPNAHVIDFIVAAIKKSDDCFECCHLAQAAGPAFRRDFGNPSEDTPEEFAHFLEREKVFEALAGKLEEFFPADAMYEEKRIGRLELILGVMPTGGFNSSNEGGKIPARIAAVRERLYARIGRLTLDAKMADIE